MMSSYYHTGKEVDMAAMTEPLCLERGDLLSRVYYIPTDQQYLENAMADSLTNELTGFCVG